ncbi:MAG: CehA/McbA family metallohydrolase [Gemmatimonadetes bacterium]|nr:CehA/McbA family metallohydrolase [Gemmatimonadota bacterium]
MTVRRYALAAVLVMAVSAAALAFPNRFPTVSIRVENHLLPAVSTGPLDPAFSPDGAWIAFSARGDVWKVPAGGGVAEALTGGPAYHFEPAWSPDGRSLALTVDTDGNLDIGVVSAAGGEVERLTTHPHVDVEPTWSADGQSVYFVTGRNRNLDIYRIDLADRTGQVVPVTSSRGNEIQPAVSPDGTMLAYVAGIPGRQGSGGIWVMPLPVGEPRLVLDEETAYRAKPSWTADGIALIFVSDFSGSNDIAVVPVDGGNPLRLTTRPVDEFAPVMSPDGSTIAFVANDGGPTRLVTIPFGGGGELSWTEVAIDAYRAREPAGVLRARVLDPDGNPVSARVTVVASDGRSYTPRGGFHRVISGTETHYFHTDGEFTVTVPAGSLTVEALKGFEYRPASATTHVDGGGAAEVTLRLERLVDLPARGWYSGDTHVHDLHSGRFRLSHEDFFLQIEAEDIHMAHSLIHMDGTRVMGRWQDLTGRPHPLSTSDHILQYGEEFRGSFGHVAMLGIDTYVMPMIGGAAGTVFGADVLNGRYLDAARAQGGIAGFVHPYNAVPSDPSDAANSEIPVNVALGQGDFYDVVCIFSDELASAHMYHRILNAGFRLAATGGSDDFGNVWRGAPPGTGRTYALLDAPLSVDAWLAAVRAGRTFGTNGPLLVVSVEGRGPGEEIALQGSAQRTFEVLAEAVSIAPLEKLEIYVNGEVVETVHATGDSTRFSVSTRLEIPGSAWVAAQVVGPRHRYFGDSYAFAHTSPVYIVRDGKPFASADDARFLADVVAALWERVDRRDRWTSDADKEHYREALARAEEVYREIARAAR